jgi:hypothetical protein
MLPIRQTPLPPPVEYALDSAAEGGEIDLCTSSTLRLYGDAIALDELVGRPRMTRFAAGQKPENTRRVAALKMMDMADEILPQLDLERKGALIHDGIKGVRLSINSISEAMCSWALEDAVEGGAMEAFKPVPLVDRHGRPHRRIMRRLCSPSFIRRYVKRSDQLYELKSSMTRLLQRVQSVPLRYVTANDDLLWRDMDAQIAAYREHRRGQREQEEREFWRRAIPTDQRPEAPKLDRGKRKILKRASKIASSVLGVTAVNALSRGDKIKVDGPSLSLQIQKRGMLTDTGHGTLDIAFTDHGGALLAKLCVYQENIPAIDQAVGFALMMQSGLEKELLDEANLTTVTDEGQRNEMIVGRHAKAIAGSRTGVRFVGRHMRWGYEQEQAWRQIYWLKTKPMWTDTVTVVVLGRNRKMIERIAG